VTGQALYSVVLSGTGEDQKVMDLDSASITDAAQIGTTLYASTFSRLMKIDLAKNTLNPVGNMGTSSINALAVHPNGTLYGVETDGELYQINRDTGAGTRVGSLGYASSGDLTFTAEGTLYATVKVSGYSSDVLVRMSLSEAKSTIVGATKFDDVYGLDLVNGVLYGRTNAGKIITINTATGQGTVVRSTGLSFTSLP